MAEQRVHFPIERVHDVILSKEDFVIGDFPNADRFIGLDKVIRSDILLAPPIDLRPYRQVQLWTFVQGLTGGSSPFIQWSLELNPTGRQDRSYISNAPNTGNSGNTPAVPTVLGVLGSGGVGWTSLSGGVIASTTTFGSPVVPPFTRIKFWTSGGPSGFTSAGLYLLGLR